MSLSPEITAAAITSAAATFGASLAVLKVWVKWRRDRDILSIQQNTAANAANADEIARLWTHADKIGEQVEECRNERQQLIEKNHALTKQNAEQAGQIEGLTNRCAGLEKHIGELERKLGGIGSPGQALT